MSYCPEHGIQLDLVKEVGSLVYYHCNPGKWRGVGLSHIVIYNPDRFPSPVYEMSELTLGELTFIEYDEERERRV